MYYKVIQFRENFPPLGIHIGIHLGLGRLEELRAFFRTAADLVEDNSDAEFYFEQFVDHISNGGSLSSDDSVVVRRILGL